MLLAVEMVADKDSKTPSPRQCRPNGSIQSLRNLVMLYCRKASGGRFGHWFMVRRR
jgi:hypothetical protein